MGRHAASARTRSRWGAVPRVVFAVAALALVIATVVTLWSGGHSPRTKNDARTADSQSCDDAGAVSVMPGTGSRWQGVLTAYARSIHSSCLPLALSEAPPASTGALTLTYSAANTGTAVASTPIMLGMPLAAAQALGVQGGGTLGPDMLATLVTQGWSAFGQSWGRPSIAIARPEGYTSGLAALGVLATAIYGGTPPGLDYQKPTADDQAMLAALRAITSPAATDGDVFAAAPNPGRLYIAPEPAFDAAAAKALNLTVVPLFRQPVAIRAQLTGGDTVERRFLTYLTSPVGQASLREAGLGAPAGAVSMTPARADDVAFLWSLTHRDVTALALFDVSGSMADPLPGSTTPKATLLKQAIATMLGAVSPQAVTALRYFHSAPDHSPVITGSDYAVNSAVQNGRTHAAAEIAAANAVQFAGGTPLYLAVRQGYAYALAHYRPGTPNNLLVLTDGKDEDNNTGITLAQLTAELAHARDPNRPIQVRCIALGAGADTAALRAIAAATNGSVLPLNSPAQLSTVVTGLFG